MNLLGLDGESRKPGDGDRSKDAGSGKGHTPPTRGSKGVNDSAPEAEGLADAVLSLLKGSPMKMMDAEFMVKELRHKGFDVARETLLAELNHQKAFFRLYSSGDGTLVSRV